MEPTVQRWSAKRKGEGREATVHDQELKQPRVTIGELSLPSSGTGVLPTPLRLPIPTDLAFMSHRFPSLPLVP